MPAVWQRVQDQVAKNPAYGWISGLVLVRIDGSTAVLAPRKGCENQAKIASGAPQQRKLASLLEPIVGRTLSFIVEQESVTRPANRASAPAPGNAPANQPAQGPGGPPAGAPARQGDEGGQAPRGDRRSDMQKAHQLPLVRQLMEMFNADIVDAHPERPKEPPPGADAAENGNDAGSEPSAKPNDPDDIDG